MQLWVQQVDILYTKASRGAPQATVRNRLPRAFVMHVAGEPAFAFAHHRLLEWNDFQPVLQETGTAAAPPRGQNDLVIGASGDVVTLGLRWRSSIGQPARHDRPKAITLRPGQTARLIINGRYTSYSGQVYTEATYNVAFGERLPDDVFLASEPADVLDLRAELF